MKILPHEIEQDKTEQEDGDETAQKFEEIMIEWVYHECDYIP
jgi:hypothetical protein